ncbi:MAG: hypothetical protein GY854_30235 [Deltaproteobacteria bacterium]|nr:hypothetical protein [Deltaproteobacteria bacterium]
MKELKLYLDQRASQLDERGITALRIELIREIRETPDDVRDKRGEITWLAKTLEMHPIRMRKWVEALGLWGTILEERAKAR